MSFPKYEIYKNSGVEWLGEVPEHWICIPIKYLAILNPNKSGYQGDQTQACSFLPMGKLRRGTLILDEERTIYEVYSGYTYFENGDILQAKVTPCFENGNIAIANELTNGVGFGSSEINVLRIFEDIFNKFIYYRLQENNFMDFCVSSMTGVAGLQRIPSDTINNFIIALPKKDEQTQIARFLDHETARIDALIAEQQRLIELLKEKRQAVISHAVTKGLDPTAPMKDSGVQWLGEVPAHWEVCRSKIIFDERNTKATENDEQLTASQKYGVIPQRLFSELEGQKVMQVILGREILKKAEINDFVISMRSFQGGLEFCPYSGAVSSAYVPLYPKKEIDNKFFKYLFKAKPFIIALQQTSNLVRDGQALRYSNFTQLSLPFPTLVEQGKIGTFLSQETARIDGLIAEAHTGVSLLQERRSALISAAVTGKIDVRNWQPPANTQPEPTPTIAHG